MKRAYLVKVLAFVACAASVSYEAEGAQDQSAEIPQWLVDGASACNEAQLHLENPIWDSTLKRPKVSEFDWLWVSTNPNASYYVLSIGYQAPYPDAPHAFCHVSALTNTVMSAGYWIDFTDEPHKQKYIQFSEYEKMSDFELGSFESWGVSLAEVLAAKRELE